MKFSAFIAVLALTLAIAAGGAVAQTPPQVYRVGVLTGGPLLTDESPLGAGLIRGFARQGFILGKTLAFERRGAQGHVDRLLRLVGELVASKVAVIVTSGYPAALAAKEHSTLPVVAVFAGDPVATGLVQSFARPGGNVTGISEVAAELSAKRLALLKEAVPGLRKVAMLWNADDLGMTLRYKAADTEAEKLGVAVQSLGVREPDDFDTAFAAMTRDPPDAILMVTDALTILNRKRVFEFAAAHKLPAIYEFAFLVRDGGLMSYGPDESESFDRAAGLAVRILKGAKPAELPLELPTRFIFAINLGTAKSIGLTIPPSLLARADVVIE
jgi:putative tryptophan/tyrosine transport system substrate-binding protein